MKLEAKPILPLATTSNKAKAAKAKTTRTSRKVSQDTSIYGEELFIESIRKEREVIIHFSDFNQHKLRFSDDGEFIIGYKFIDYDTEIFTLYHCLEAVEFSNDILELEASDKIFKFEFPTIYNVRDQISKIVKDDLWQEKQAKVQAQKEADEINRRLEEVRKQQEEVELEKADKEFLATENSEFSVTTKIIEETESTTTIITEPEIVESVIVEEVGEVPSFFKPVRKFVIAATQEIVDETNEEIKEEVKPKFQFTLRKDS